MCLAVDFTAKLYSVITKLLPTMFFVKNNLVIVTTANNKLYNYDQFYRLPECGSLTEILVVRVRFELTMFTTWVCVLQTHAFNHSDHLTAGAVGLEPT